VALYLSETIQVNWYQASLFLLYQHSKTNLDFTEARDIEWQWHQLDHMQVCTSLQTDNHASTLPLSVFTGWMPFLPPNQQHHSTKGILGQLQKIIKRYSTKPVHLDYGLKLY